MKDAYGTIHYHDQDYKIVFNLNVMEEIQNKYGTIQKWGALTDRSKGEVNAAALKFGITAMLNEGIDIDNETLDEKRPFFTEKQVGRMIYEIGVEEAVRRMNQTVIDSAGSTEKNA